MMPSARDILQAGRARLQARGLESARQDAEWLLSRLLGVAALDLYVEERDVPEPLARRFFLQVDQRAAGMPVQYLAEEAEFLGERLRVAPGVFIPRPETEAVLEAVLPALRRLTAPAGRPLRLLDLGTGSGCIAIALARRLPACLIVGVELSWDSLRIAQANAARAGLAGRVQWVRGRWVDGLRGPFDGIIANPPYVPSAQVDRLPLDVRREPRMSLDGGADGMRDARIILSALPAMLAPGGVAAMECGETQVEVLLADVRHAGWAASAEPLQDLAGRPRGLVISRPT